MYSLLSANHINRRGKIMKTVIELALLSYIFAVNVLISTGCPHIADEVKAAYKSGVTLDQPYQPITLKTIKKKLEESGVFDIRRVTLNGREEKELSNLFEALEIMTSSRDRQPSNAQRIKYSLSLVQDAVKKLLKEGRISDSLAAKFDWDKLYGSRRRRRDMPQYYLDKTTNMRVFNTK